ncbi:MAG: VWA domain-containing protein [Bryobacteraceae bacterium]
MRTLRWFVLLLVVLTLAASLGAQFKRADPAQTPAQPPSQPSAPGAPPAGDDQVIKVDVSLVNLYFTVRENRGGYVGGLKQDDFEVYEDGQPQTIKTFMRETGQPLTIGLLVDVSGSQERLLEDERAASARFFEQVLRPKDMAFLLSFGVDSDLLQDFTNSHSLLERALRDMRMNAGFRGITPSTVPTTPRGTVLYEAVWLASREKMRTEVGRKALVLITDGDDQGSRTKPAEAIEAAQKSDSILYVILYEDPRFHNPMFGHGSSEGEMRRMTDDTGGRTFRVDRRNTLNDIYNQLQEELRSQYVIAYTPTNPERDGRFRKIEIRVKNRKDAKVQARKGYYALAPGSE